MSSIPNHFQQPWQQIFLALPTLPLPLPLVFSLEPPQPLRWEHFTQSCSMKRNEHSSSPFHSAARSVTGQVHNPLQVPFPQHHLRPSNYFRHRAMWYLNLQKLPSYIVIHQSIYLSTCPLFNFLSASILHTQSLCTCNAMAGGLSFQVNCLTVPAWGWTAAPRSPPRPPAPTPALHCAGWLGGIRILA